jgi:hypothetical protein
MNKTNKPLAIEKRSKPAFGRQEIPDTAQINASYDASDFL